MTVDGDILTLIDYVGDCGWIYTNLVDDVGDGEWRYTNFD